MELDTKSGPLGGIPPIVCLLVVLLTATPAQASGTIVGTVRTAAPALPPIRITTDQRVCGVEQPDRAIERDGAGRLANVVVILSGTRNPKPVAQQPVINENCRFVPRVQVAAPNAIIQTSSKDPVLHNTNAQAESGPTLFNVSLPAPGIVVSRPLRGPGIVRVFCNVHPWMRAWIVVSDELAAVTGQDGHFTFADVPPGKYEVRFWHESLAAPAQTITVSAGGSATLETVMK